MDSHEMLKDALEQNEILKARIKALDAQLTEALRKLNKAEIENAKLKGGQS